MYIYIYIYIHNSDICTFIDVHMSVCKCIYTYVNIHRSLRSRYMIETGNIAHTNLLRKIHQEWCADVLPSPFPRSSNHRRIPGGSFSGLFLGICHVKGKGLWIVSTLGFPHPMVSQHELQACSKLPSYVLGFNWVTLW